MQALVRRFIVRCLKLRMIAHRHWAALQIQRIWRGMLGRDKATDVRKGRLAGASGRSGIAFIVKLKQFAARVLKRARIALAKQRKAATLLQSLQRGRISRAIVIEVCRQKETWLSTYYGVIHVQRVWRGLVTRRKLAVKAQAAYAIHNGATGLQRVCISIASCIYSVSQYSIELHYLTFVELSL
jgi:IQ calmodulin-binding motif